MRITVSTIGLFFSALATMGVLHFAAPKAFDRIIPSWVPGRARTWTYASGVAELTSAALVAKAW